MDVADNEAPSFSLSARSCTPFWLVLTRASDLSEVYHVIITTSSSANTIRRRLDRNIGRMCWKGKRSSWREWRRRVFCGPSFRVVSIGQYAV
jgi:hypothetical protein